MIGKAAASLIREGDRIILDASTTVQSCAEHLPDVNCTIITNSINLADVLSSRKGADIRLLGGKLQKSTGFCTAPLSLKSCHAIMLIKR